MTPPASRRYECFDLQQHAAFLEARRVFIQPTGPKVPEPFHTTFSARFVQGAYVVRVRYGAALRVVKSEPEWSWQHVVSMPVTGQLSSVSKAREFIAHPEQFSIRPPAQEQRYETTEQTDELYLGIKPGFLRTYCARWLGRPLPCDIEFAPVLSPSSPHGRAIRVVCEMFLGCASDTPQELHKRDSQFEEFIASTLLLHQPHNFRDELLAPAPLPAPRDLKRALDYIHANLPNPIQLGDLVKISNVPGRTLNEHFRRFLGGSPMAYVKRERLRFARELLMKSDDTPVTEIATRCGFYHLGRFSVEYRRAFGETPSATRGCRRPRLYT